MRLGNDIVDSAATADHNPRFADRILSLEEKTRGADLWKSWAAKEAAYKAIRQTRDIPFHHREFIVAADFLTVRWHEEILNLRITTDPIFAIATDAPLEYCHSCIHTFPSEVKPEVQSRKARELLLDLAAAHLHMPRSDLSISTDQRIPHILHQGQRLDRPTSLTHHGRFVAASLAVPPR